MTISKKASTCIQKVPAIDITRIEIYGDFIKEIKVSSIDKDEVSAGLYKDGNLYRSARPSVHLEDKTIKISVQELGGIACSLTLSIIIPRSNIEELYISSDYAYIYLSEDVLTNLLSLSGSSPVIKTYADFSKLHIKAKNSMATIFPVPKHDVIFDVAVEQTEEIKVCLDGFNTQDFWAESGDNIFYPKIVINNDFNASGSITIAESGVVTFIHRSGS